MAMMDERKAGGVEHKAEETINTYNLTSPWTK